MQAASKATAGRARGFLADLRRDTGGNVLALSAAALLPLAAMIGGALDMSMVYMARARLQNACDAGVLAGRHLMQGTVFNSAVETEAARFFDFNFPDSGMATSIAFEVEQSTADKAEIVGTASASVPTILMKIFGFGAIDIGVSCNAKKDFGDNDIVLVLDVTGSMNCPPGVSGGCSGVERVNSKASRLRAGARGLYAALADAPSTTTRYGIVPYSHTANVAGSLSNDDILRNQLFVDRRKERVCGRRGCSDEWVIGSKTVHIDDSDSSWRGKGSTEANLTAFRTSGEGCIEERSSVGNAASPVSINDTVIRADIDNRAANSLDTALQFGRYDPDAQEQESQSGCPAEATTLQSYGREEDFQDAIDDATSILTGGTYHDVGMLWGARFISRTGFFSANNPTERSGVPVNQHIVYMTDGALDTGDELYSAHGIERYQARTLGDGGLNSRHIARFRAVCNVAKSMGVTIWVIALDVGDTADIAPCATSDQHFFISDGSDLEDVFERIGQGIGRLRLTR